ncbi:hypothetical protein [Bacillus sp. RIT 809]|uniref:hypothetical protein n=1 Tax=Bacillus sp. RIT 809 TaxID=2803857 RepID=UPI001950A7F4|nr:hypothetical protein [Bacillus sp. RIT 809]MBM6648305.1 hypothetical protein [Bacillus sp. RIT 809]
MGDKGLNKIGHVAKGAKASSGISTIANAAKLAKELKPTLEMLQSFKRDASYAFSSVGGTIITKIPQGELIEAFYKFAKSKDGGKGKPSSNKNTNVDDFDAKIATNKQKGNYGEIKSSDNLLNNQSLKDAGFDLKLVGKSTPSSINDKIVKGIDGLYENANPNPNSNIKYVIDEAKFGSSKLGKTKDGPQMSNDWLNGSETGKSRILKAVDGDEVLAEKIANALEDSEVERVLSKVDSSGNVKTYRLDEEGNNIGEWP